jgi:hypothetical protein
VTDLQHLGASQARALPLLATSLTRSTVSNPIHLLDNFCAVVVPQVSGAVSFASAAGSGSIIYALDISGQAVLVAPRFCQSDVPAVVVFATLLHDWQVHYWILWEAV